MSHFQYNLAAVYILSSVSVQTFVWIGVIKRCLECVKCIVLSGALCYSALQGAAQFVLHSIGCCVDHVVVRTKKGRKYLRHTRKRTCIWSEIFGISTIFKEKEMVTRQVDWDKPIYLVTPHVFNLRTITTWAVFVPKTIHIEFVIDKLVLRQASISDLRILL